MKYRNKRTGTVIDVKSEVNSAFWEPLDIPKSKKASKPKPVSKPKPDPETTKKESTEKGEQ